MPRHGHSAVDRNRLKRRLREITRIHVLPALPPIDLIIRARPGAYDLPFEDLVRELSALTPEP